MPWKGSDLIKKYDIVNDAGHFTSILTQKRMESNRQRVPMVQHSNVTMRNSRNAGWTWNRRQNCTGPSKNKTSLRLGKDKQHSNNCSILESQWLRQINSFWWTESPTVFLFEKKKTEDTKGSIEQGIPEMKQEKHSRRMDILRLVI